jgi:membrane fusion protein, copper/silver efflux system
VWSFVHKRRLEGRGHGPPSKSDTGGSAAHGPQSQPAKPGEGADPGVSAELAKLPPEEQALAKKQKVCPVTDAPLGSMGVPVKVSLKGRTVFLCCEGCEEELKKNADKYLAKLDHPATK